MTYKPLFSEKEWDTIKISVMRIFRAVAGADGNIDTNEQLALKKITENAVWIENGFVREVIDDISIDIPGNFRKSISDQRNFREGMNDLLVIFDKSGIEQRIIVGFKKALIAIGFYVANISGSDYDEKMVSTEEANVLKSLTGILGLTANDLREKPNIQSYMEVFAGVSK
jgi:hypothetical protein